MTNDKKGYKLIKQSSRKIITWQVASYVLALISISTSLVLVNFMQTMIDKLQIGAIDNRGTEKASV